MGGRCCGTDERKQKRPAKLGEFKEDLSIEDFSVHVTRERYDIPRISDVMGKDWKDILNAFMIIASSAEYLSQGTRKWISAHFALHGVPREHLKIIREFEIKKWTPPEMTQLLAEAHVQKMKMFLVYIYFKMEQETKNDPTGSSMPLEIFEELGVEAEMITKIHTLIDHELFNKKERVHLLFPDSEKVKRTEESYHVM
ncbi:hypothetical protein AAMO2058_000707600 [Amorphochlora amoebiformis]